MMLTATDWIFVAAPIFGTIINFICQVGLARRCSLPKAVIAAFCLGAMMTLAIIVAPCLLGPAPLLDGVGMAVSALIAYGCSGFVLFALVNLGQTSFRFQMLAALADHPAGMSSDALLASVPESDGVSARVRRLEVNRQVRVVGDRFFPRVSVLTAVEAGVSVLRWLVYG